jgi:hypothetical protein
MGIVYVTYYGESRELSSRCICGNAPLGALRKATQGGDMTQYEMTDCMWLQCENAVQRLFDLVALLKCGQTHIAFAG